MATTALALITTAFQTLNVFQSGEAIPAADAADALTLLNNWMASLALETQALPVTIREVFSLTAGKGGPGNPYTMGVGGTFNTDRPPSAASLSGAAILLGATNPAIEVPRALVDDEVYEAIRIKDLSNPLFTHVYYNPTFADGLASINLWPVPNTALHQLILYRRQALGAFVSLGAAYQLAPGYEEAIVYNLVRRMAPVWGKALSGELLDLARTSLARVKRANTAMTDLPLDPMFTATRRRGGYNIVSGAGG